MPGSSYCRWYFLYDILWSSVSGSCLSFHSSCRYQGGFQEVSINSTEKVLWIHCRKSNRFEKYSMCSNCCVLNFYCLFFSSLSSSCVLCFVITINTYNFPSLPSSVLCCHPAGAVSELQTKKCFPVAVVTVLRYI